MKLAAVESRAAAEPAVKTRTPMKSAVKPAAKSTVTPAASGAGDSGRHHPEAESSHRHNKDDR